MKRISKANNLGLVARKLSASFGSLRIPALIAFILAAAGAVLTIIGPNQLSRITEYMSEALYGSIDMAAIARVGIMLAVIYAASALFTFIQHYIMATITLRFSKQLRSDLSRKINKVPLEFFNSVSHGDMLSCITNDVSTLQQTLSNSLPSIISAAAQFVGCIIMMFVTEWRLALCTMGSTLIGLGVMGVILLRSQKYFVAHQQRLGKLNGYVEEMYSGHDVVRISRAERRIKSVFSTLNSAVYEANWKSQFLSGIMSPLMNVVGNIGYVAVCVVGSALTLSGDIKFGVIIAFIMYVRLFTSPLGTIAQGMTNIQSAAAAGKRVFDFLEQKEMPDESSKPAASERIRGEIEFRHVCFSYPDAPDRIIIRDFCAHVLPGQKVAIVGPTGAGKTTMVNLLMRFYEINSGEILIDGTPISAMRRESVHRLFGMVLQDTWIFEGSVRENLAYNNGAVSDEALEAACRACGIYRFIKALPHGFDTVLNENVTISAGQKQLLTIARAMIQNCPMLILDEATSSVDTRTELITQRAMDALMKDRTSFVIAHRLSTIRNADLILVLNDGDIVEQGTHEELLDLGGFYAKLYKSQFDKSL